jgi:hypothetical protein
MKTTVVLEISLKNTLAFWDFGGYLIFVAILYKQSKHVLHRHRTLDVTEVEDIVST